MQKHVSKAAAKLVNKPLKVAKADVKLDGKAVVPARFAHETPPERFTYALAGFSAERRKDGWWVGKTAPTFSSEKQKWTGPFNDIENACLSIARHLAVELADRHTRSIEAYKLKPADPLYGLKPTTRLRAR